MSRSCAGGAVDLLLDSDEGAFPMGWRWWKAEAIRYISGSFPAFLLPQSPDIIRT